MDILYVIFDDRWMRVWISYILYLIIDGWVSIFYMLYLMIDGWVSIFYMLYLMNVWIFYISYLMIDGWVCGYPPIILVHLSVGARAFSIILSGAHHQQNNIIRDINQFFDSSLSQENKK